MKVVRMKRLEPVSSGEDPGPKPVRADLDQFPDDVDRQMQFELEAERLKRGDS